MFNDRTQNAQSLMLFARREDRSDLGDDLLSRGAGGQHSGDAGCFEPGDVGYRHDSTDDHRDVDATSSGLLDHQRCQRHVCARQHRQADGIDVFIDRCSRNGGRSLEQTGVDDLVPRVAQDPGDHLDAAIVTIEADLGDENALPGHRGDQNSHQMVGTSTWRPNTVPREAITSPSVA